MDKIYKCLFVFMILLVSVGFACASDDIASNNDTSVLSIDDDASVVVNDASEIKESDNGKDLLEDMDEESLADSSDNKHYEIITRNDTKYDFHDDYKVKVVNESGIAVYGGHIDFYVNHNLATTSKVNYFGYASFNLNSYITSKGTYEIVSIYSDNGDYGNAVTRQSIVVDDIPMDQRDIQIHFENIKLYDLGEQYRVKVLDKNGDPVRKGYVIFITYDYLFYSNISETGIASFYLPNSLNITGHLLVGTMYSDGELNDLAAVEQITIGTRTTVALDKSSLGSRMMHSWNNYNFTYSEEGMYIAPIKKNVNLVLDIWGKCYLMYENTINTSSQLSDEFYFLSLSYDYDVVKLNLLADTTYTLKNHVWEDQEWYYASRVANGQLIVNGNGATIKPHEDASSLLNFMFIGREANVNFVNVNLNKFNHVFINHGNLLCERCVFRENYAYKLDVKLSGSGTVVHNYNTVFLDGCGFYDNDAEFMAFGKLHMEASILYAEPFSLNIFNGLYGKFYSDSFYCCNFTTTIFYDVDNSFVMNKLTDSVFDQNSYFATVDREVLIENNEVTLNVRTKSELMSAFYMLNSFINASKVTINLAPGTYEFTTDDIDYHVRAYNYRHVAQDPSGPDYTIQDMYLLDVGYCPVTINGNGAMIKLSGNDDSDDYHFAYIGKFGSLKLNRLDVRGFNTAFLVTGNLEAYNCYFADNVIDHAVVAGDYGGVFRSHGGKVTFHSIGFTGNRADNIGDYSTSDFYADMASSIDLINCIGKPQGYMTGNSYLKSDAMSMENVHGYTYYEKFDYDYATVDFKVFNVSDTNSYNKLRDYFSNHKVKSLYVNFTGDYSFDLHPVFDRAMAIVFNSNGHNVKFNRMKIESPSTMTFIGFDFDNLMVEIKGTATFINCKFHNNKQGEDYFFTNEGSCTLINCDFYDNEGDDSIIYNTGSLTIYDGSFKNNEFDDDYGIIYNYGGSVSCINATFSGNTEGYYIFNFASGNCVYSGSGSTLDYVEFDEAWANWKAGLVQGAFLLGTALVTYGAGTAVGAFIPGVAGFVIASVAGAGIGAVSGLTYGLIEGSVYHDYSNVWKHSLTFALMGLGLAQSGFAAQANFIRQVDKAFNNRASAAEVPGNPRPPAPQNPQGGQGAGGLEALENNPAFQAELKGSIEADIEALINAFGNQYDRFINTIQSALRSFVFERNVDVQQMLTFYTTLETILARQQVVNPQEAPANIINRVANNPNAVVEPNHLPPAAEIVPLDAGNFVLTDGYTYMMRAIENNHRINYIANMLSVNSLRFIGENQTHADRVMNLLSNVNALYNRARNLGFNQVSETMNTHLRFLNHLIGAPGLARTINGLFDYNSIQSLEFYEGIYRATLNDLIKAINASNIRGFDLDGNVNITRQLESRITNLITQLDKKFENDPDNLDKYKTLKDLYNNSNHNELETMLKIYVGLSDLAKIPKMNMKDYYDAISFNYIDLIKNNIYYSVFSIPNSFSHISDFSDMLIEVNQNLNVLREINVTVYNEVINIVFGGNQFRDWRNSMRALHNSDPQNARRIVIETYQQAYDYFNLYHRDKKAINEAHIDIYHVKNLFLNYLDVYERLSNSNKIILNRYFYDQCSELIKSFNGIHIFHGIMDETENFNNLNNISDTSRGYFKRLTELYTILISSKGNENLFNKNITGLTSSQIGDMILEDLVAYNTINFIRSELTSGFWGQDHVNFNLLAKIMNWINNNSIVNLQSFYNNMSAFREELQAVYTLEQQVFFEQPVDIELFRNKIHDVVSYRTWLGFAFGSKISGLFGFTNMGNYIDVNKEFIVRWFIDQLNDPNLPYGPQEKQNAYKRSILYLTVFNKYYLKDSNIDKTKWNLVEMLLAEASSTYSFKKVFSEQYSSLVNLNLGMDLNTVKQRQRDKNPDSEDFSDIDVANITQKLKLLKTASPTAFWVLMDQFSEKYDVPVISETKWTFNHKESQFYTTDVNDVSVSYYDFATSVVNAINNILQSIGVIDGNQIILKSMNYNIARLVDTDNKYNNIFNKKAYYNQMELTEDNVKLMINDMEYDLNYLKNLDNGEYYDILIDQFFEGQTFSDWVKNHDGNEILYAYNTIFDTLDEYRNNSQVLKNEINVLINQLNNNTVKNLKNNNLTSQIRADLLYFIFFWEYFQKNTDENKLIFRNDEPGLMMSYRLLNAPLQDIFNRYSEILNRMSFFGAFTDDVDLNKLSLDEMKDLFNNNLYRAYHGPNRYAAVFEYLNAHIDEYRELQARNDFRAYENYINSIGDKNILIEWYNAIRDIITSNGNANVKPNPQPNQGAVSILTPAILNDIEKIILDNSIYDNDPMNIFNSRDQGYFMGSWKAFVKKYGEISNIVLKDLMKGDLDKFIIDNGYDFHAIRQKIVNFLKNYKPANNQPVNEKDSSISKSQFEDIKKIMENTNLEPEKVYNIINPYMVRLYGSWEKMEDMYPDVAKFVSTFLLENVDLATYANKYGDFKNNYKNIRQNIIEFIRLNLLREDEPNVVDIVNIEDMGKVDILINGKKVSECSIDDIHAYTVEKIRTTEIDDALMNSLLLKADSIYQGYLQYVDSMKSANVPENEYSNGFNQFKNRYVDILKQVNSKDENSFGKIIRITSIFRDTFIQPDVIMTDSLFDFYVFLGAWEKLEKEYPDVAKYILETHFNNNMGKLKDYYLKFGNDEKARDQFTNLATMYFTNYPNPKSNSNAGGMVIGTERVLDASIDQIMEYTQNAYEKANAYVEQIRQENPDLADSLRNNVNELYGNYKYKITTYNAKLQYILFVVELNKLFENVTLKNKPVNVNPQKNNYHIPKEKIIVLSPIKAAQLMLNAMDSVKTQVDKIMKTNKKLAQWVLDRSSELVSKYSDGILAGDMDSYTTFINELNKLFKDSVGFSSSAKIEDEVLKAMDKKDIENLIKLKLHLNPNLEYSSQFLKKIDQSNLNKEDLINIYKALNPYIIKESNLRMKNKILTTGSTFFEIKSSDLSNINKVKNSINSNLNILKVFFPNLYYSISKLFQDDLSRLSQLSLQECVNLHNRLSRYTKNYFNAFKNSQSFKNEIQSRIMEVELYPSQIALLKMNIFNFFDSSSVYFLRNLDNSDAETIKKVIESEMLYMGLETNTLYEYYLNKYFKGYPSPSAYFASLNGKFSPEKEDKFFQEFYKNIYNDFKSMRDMHNVIDNLKSDQDKKDYYIKSFEKAHNVNLSSDAAKFTRNLVIALMNLPMGHQQNITNMLLQGLNKDGSLKEDAKKEILEKIARILFIAEDGIFTLKGEDFEMLVDIMTLNFQKSFNIQIILDYVQFKFEEEGIDEIKDLARYNLILSLILKNKILFDSKNVVLYPEELDLLNNLSALKCYKLINEILQLKLKAEFSNKNTVAEGLVPGLNDILNSMEYKLLNNKKVNAGDHHINLIYTIFNNVNNIPNNLRDLVNLMDNEVKKLSQIDANLYMLIMSRFFMALSVKDFQEDYHISLEKLKGIYTEIANILNFWRNKDISNQVARV